MIQGDFRQINKPESWIMCRLNTPVNSTKDYKSLNNIKKSVLLEMTDRLFHDSLNSSFHNSKYWLIIGAAYGSLPTQPLPGWYAFNAHACHPRHRIVSLRHPLRTCRHLERHRRITPQYSPHVFTRVTLARSQNMCIQLYVQLLT